MSPEKQRIAIAEACGWTRIHTAEDSFDGPFLRGRQPVLKTWDEVPDYLSDLNAMAEAEKVLKEHDLTCPIGGMWWPVYTTWLIRITQRSIPLDATAAQRAEAFLRTLNKWEDA